VNVYEISEPDNLQTEQTKESNEHIKTTWPLASGRQFPLLYSTGRNGGVVYMYDPPQESKDGSVFMKTYSRMITFIIPTDREPYRG
jgi:hypothetical protein